jgi:uncharacterized Tic20 family protein
MNQPELGLKVTELRQQKGLTQEQLAERCEVSARTIQRIESGEVDPRAYTLHCLGEALDFDFGEVNKSNENFWLALLHLSSIFSIPVFPLLIWSWKKNQSIKIDQQGRQALNFQITMILTLFVAAFLLMMVPAAFLLIGKTTLQTGEGFPIILATLCAPLPLILLGIYCFYQGVVNTIRALSGKTTHYDLSIPFLK